MLRTVLAAVAVAALFAGTALAAGDGGPPYEEGPRGGDQFNYTNVDRDAGRITMGRLYPVPAVVSCGGAGAYAMFQHVLEPAQPATTVTVAYDEAVLESYVWLAATVRGPGGAWLGAQKQRGPLLLDGEITVDLGDRAAALAEQLEVDTIPLEVTFGMELGSACPYASAGTVRYTNVTAS